MTAPRVPGITLRFDPKRAATGLGWGVFVDVRLNGTRHSPSKFFATEAEAEEAYASAMTTVAAMRAEAAQRARLTKALNLPPLPQAPKGVALFEPMALAWLEEQVKPPRRTASTYLGYQRLLKLHLFPLMRTWPVNDDGMSTLRLTELLKDTLYTKGVSLTTRIACLRCLGSFFAWARTKLPPRQLSSNPVADFQTTFLRQDDEVEIELIQEPNPMTRVQVEAFLKWQQDHYPEVYEFFTWLVDAGSRVGEVSALKWEHLDLARGKAHVVDAFSWQQRTFERQQERLGVKTKSAGLGEHVSLPRPAPPRRHRGIGEKDTKTHRRNQYIDLSDRLVEVLTALKPRTLEAWMKRGRYGKEPQHVFLTSHLTPRRPDRIVYRAFREACAALELQGQTGQRFTVHCLRDTFATLAILEGKLDLGWVAMMLGHSTEDTLKKHYYKYVRLVEANPLAGIKR
jgi:integrase